MKSQINNDNKKARIINENDDLIYGTLNGLSIKQKIKQ